MTNSTQELLIDETVCVLEGKFQYKDSKPSNNNMVKRNKVSFNKQIQTQYIYAHYKDWCLLYTFCLCNILIYR